MPLVAQQLQHMAVVTRSLGEQHLDKRALGEIGADDGRSALSRSAFDGLDGSRIDCLAGDEGNQIEMVAAEIRECATASARIGLPAGQGAPSRGELAADGDDPAERARLASVAGGEHERVIAEVQPCHPDPAGAAPGRDHPVGLRKVER